MKWRPIAFGARKLKGAETRYNVTEQECLAVVFALRRMRHDLHGGPTFTIVTDHIVLKWLMYSRDPRGRLARWVVGVQVLNLQSVMRPARLSRFRTVLAEMLWRRRIRRHYALDVRRRPWKFENSHLSLQSRYAKQYRKGHLVTQQSMFSLKISSCLTRMV